MIIDSSAIVAILTKEDDQVALIHAILESSDNRISAGTYIEIAAVISQRYGGTLHDAFDTLMQEADIAIVPVDVAQARIGRTAYHLYGRGSGHPARLNFGGCFAYALAKETGEPMLFKGDAFTHTDIARAI